MKKHFLIGLMVCFLSVTTFGQNQTQSGLQASVSRDNLMLRPNSRDYNIIRKGNNHQRIIQMRTQTLVRQKQAVLNRKAALDRRRTSQQQQMIKKQQMRQRLLRQRSMHR